MSMVLASVAVFSSPSHAEMRALLIGVSSYPTLPARYRLEGPRNDVERMRQVLRQRGFGAAQIETLADGVAGAAMPTRDNILGALARMAVAARPDDIVFLLFAGHGSQEPAGRDTLEGRRELDGLHETFLPIDVGRWDGARSHVDRAIVNVELRAAVDRISATGAFVWAVFDSCHSATLVRGTQRDDGPRLRRVDPLDLGIGATEMARATASAARRRAPSVETGPLGSGAPGLAPAALFYATQTDEMTPELPLPLGAPGRRSHGLFSFVLAQALEMAKPMSYRQLAQYVLAVYASIADAHATPLFAGSGLDRIVLGQQSLPLQQWPLQHDGELSIAAGQLSGIDVGTVFAVASDPLAPRDQALAYLAVTRSQAERSELAPVAFGGRLVTLDGDWPVQAQLRLVRTQPSFALHVAVRTEGCGSRCRLGEAVALLRQRPVPDVDVVWEEAAASADIILQQRDGAIEFQQALDDATEGRHPLHLALEVGTSSMSTEALAARVAAELHRIARVRNLQRIAAELAKAPPTGGVRATLARRAGANALLEAVAPDAVPRLKDGDRIELTLENPGALARDVTLLYIDADLGITALFPNALGESNRLPAGSRKVIDGIEIHSPPAGTERLMLIAVDARVLGERADYSFLQQDALATRRGDAAIDDDWFADAAFARYRTRGARSAAAPRAGTTVQLFTVRVQP